MKRSTPNCKSSIDRSDIYATKKNLENLIDEQERAIAAILARIDGARAAFGKAARDLAFMNSVVGAVPDLAGQRAAVETLQKAFAQVSLPALEAAIQAVRDGLGEAPLAIMAETCAALLASLTDAWDTAVNGDAGLRSAFIALSASRSGLSGRDQGGGRYPPPRG